MMHWDSEKKMKLELFKKHIPLAVGCRSDIFLEGQMGREVGSTDSQEASPGNILETKL